MPAYYQPSPPLSVPVPGTSEIRLPLTLPIGDNNPNLYMGYGDSITAGEGSSDGHGYVLKLQNLLGPYFARAEVQARDRTGTNSAEGAEAARRNIRIFHPAWVLVHYGTNDWNDATCQQQVDACFTIDSLRRIVEEVKGANSLPVLATIIPANPALSPSGRNTWYDQMNVRIKALASEQSVTLADLNADFKAAGSLPALFADHVHPNDAGYQVMAQGWFKAITRARSAAASASPGLGFGFRP
jgi:lysophospholipase L1-like esterase